MKCDFLCSNKFHAFRNYYNSVLHWALITDNSLNCDFKTISQLATHVVTRYVVRSLVTNSHILKSLGQSPTWKEEVS